MGELLVAILLSGLLAGIIIVLFPGLVDDYRLFQLIRYLAFKVLRKAGLQQDVAGFWLTKLQSVNCRVRLTGPQEDSCGTDAFTVEICGSIHSPSETDRIAVCISITDVTEGIAKAQPVHSRFEEWKKQGSSAFFYNADLGRLPNRNSTISDWMPVARIPLEWLMFTRRGKRDLLFNVSLLCVESGENIAHAKCAFSYENSAYGYGDLAQNIGRARTLAVPLAFAVSAADNKMYECEVKLIKKWARDNIDVCQTSRKAKRKLEKALDKTVAFFRGGNRLDTYKICKAIVEITPVSERYSILELCLRVVQANGKAAAEEVALLKKLADWLEVDRDRFHTMMEQILPATMHEVEDAEAILGVTADMDREQTQQRLNKEYRKWNARVTSCDPEIQSQADYMLRFIAEARSEYMA